MRAGPGFRHSVAVAVALAAVAVGGAGQWTTGATLAQPAQSRPPEWWSLSDWKEPAHPAILKATCAGLRALTSYDFSIDNAGLVPGESGASAYCLVQGQIVPEIRFEVALPTAWNGRLYMFGNGGFAGESLAMPIRVAMRAAALARGFVTVQTNTGHDAAREPGATFASNPQKLIDYAYRAVHVTAMTAKTIVRAYYDRPPSRSYFAGCSTGGRQALISAQRFPDDFDGIVAGAPVLDLTGTMVHYTAMHRSLGATPISSNKVRLLADKIYEKCDAADGLSDGLIADPRRCRFDIASDVPHCASGAGTASCLTDVEAKALSGVYASVTSGGRTLFPGFPVGGEAFVPTPTGPRSGWAPWIVNDGRPTISLQFAESFFRDMVTPGTPIDWRQFDPERDISKLDRIAMLLNATDPDLKAFRSRGGKLLMFFGWADPALNPLMGVNYYEQVNRTMGKDTAAFFRLFMVPGMLHCSGGNGPSSFDPVTPLVRWVEQGGAPEFVPASLRRDGKIIRSRPLCPYPSEAKYKGAGSPDDAASFSCGLPQAPASSRMPSSR